MQQVQIPFTRNSFFLYEFQDQSVNYGIDLGFSGLQTRNGFTFDFGVAGGPNTLRFSRTAPFSGIQTTGTQTVVVGTNLYGVDVIRTLINTEWGRSGPTSFASIRFIGDGDGDYTVNLVGNVDIRDFSQGPFTNSINNTTTTVWFNDGQFGNGVNQRLDMQTFDLPDTFLDENLVQIVFTDTGGTAFQRMLVSGISASVGNPTGGVTVNGTAGNDFVSPGFVRAGQPLPGDSNDRLFGFEGADSLEGGNGDDKLYGGRGDDQLYGEDGNDDLGGQTGNDVLVGGFGNDVLSGGDGDDFLYGGQGQDVLVGGNGIDRFVFNAIETPHDRVKDYVDGEDLILFSRFVFNALADMGPGPLDASAFIAGPKAKTADQHIIYNASKGHLLYDADGNGAGAAVVIAAFTNKPAIDAGDIVLV